MREESELRRGRLSGLAAEEEWETVVDEPTRVDSEGSAKTSMSWPVFVEREREASWLEGLRCCGRGLPALREEEDNGGMFSGLGGGRLFLSSSERFSCAS